MTERPIHALIDGAVVRKAALGTGLGAYKKLRSKLRQIIKSVILERYPLPGGPPPSMKFTTIVEEVNDHLVNRGLWPKPVSPSSIRRALKALADQYDGVVDKRPSS
jgi:hypothetical protein